MPYPRAVDLPPVDLSKEVVATQRTSGAFEFLRIHVGLSKPSLDVGVVKVL
jgi:hypothetical protein